MDDLPESPKYENNQPTTGQWILIGVVGVLAFIGITSFVAGGYFTATTFLEGRSQRATETTAVATAVVLERFEVIDRAAEWPLKLFDPFNDNENEWIDGTIDDEYALMDISINGDYTWEISSKQGFVWWVYPSSNMVDDFYQAVDVVNTSSNRDAPRGLIFRLSEDEQAYNYFEIRDTQLFSVWANNQGAWTEVIPYTTSTAIRPGEINHLEVVSQNDAFYFLINGQMVGDAKITYPSIGYAGVAVGLSYEDEQSTITFDNYEFRAP